MTRPAAAHVRAYLGGVKRRALRAQPSARRYLRRGVSVDRFLSTLTEERARYAVLRWFEELPTVQPGEDIDLLVADADLPRVQRLTTPYPPLGGGQKIDVYTETGHRGTGYTGVPYFSRELTRRVLDGAVLQSGRYRVPARADHFDSLAFHAVFHKGLASGLPEHTGDRRPPGPGDHDYVATLTRLGDSLGRHVDLSLEALSEYLAGEGLAPNSDTLDRFQGKNPWLRRRQALARHDIGSLTGVIVFVIREAAGELTDEILAVIERHGFEIVRLVELTPEQRARAAHHLRGGNWGRGAFPVSGGGPVSFVVAYDLGYVVTEEADGQILNSRSVRAKYAVRDLVGRDLPVAHRFNPLHSTDNGWQSVDALLALDEPEMLDEIRSQVTEIDERMQPPWPVRRYLSSNGKRARVALVDHPTYGEVVVKLFRPGASRYFERELEARRTLGDLALTPLLLEHGPNWLLTPHYEDDGSHARWRIPGTDERQLTFDTMQAVTRFVVAMRERGYFLLDLGSHNLVTDPSYGLRIVDFEFLQRYPGTAPPLDEDFTVLGNAHGAGIDEPFYGPHDRWDLRVLKTLFHPVVAGLPARAFLASWPTPTLRARMAAMQAFWWVVYSGWTVVRGARNSRRGDRILRVARRLVRG